jgi:L-ascorbate metabolism protein UlaG (beta-lactamase superfamily)
MKRRQLIGYAGAGLVTTLITCLSKQDRAIAQTDTSLSVKFLGHTSFLFIGSGLRLLANPFRTIGCTAKYQSPKVPADVVLISSQLLDEGAVDGLPGNPKIVYQPGVNDFKGFKFQGVAIDHDRIGGKRFGTNVIWKWKQGDINIVHMGGAAAPLSIEQKILIGRPDIAFIPVGGSGKAYNAEEAKKAIQILNPRIVVPTHYRTEAADPALCDISPIDEFLKVMEGTPVKRSGDTMTLTSGSLPESTTVQVMDYKF